MKKALLTLILGSFCLSYTSGFQDALDIVYDESQRYGYSSNADAEDLFDTNIGINATYSGDGDGNLDKDDFDVDVGLQGSVIARTLQFMLRMVVILAIPMVLYSAIRIMLAAGNDEKIKDALKHLGMVALGVFIALMSVVIVYLILSITRSNLINL